MIKLLHGDCFDHVTDIPDGSVDLILTDPPYGTVRGLNTDGWKREKTDWDKTLDHNKLMTECERILRPNGCLILFSQEPYTSHLISNAVHRLPFSYRMTWLKNHFGNPMIAKKAPVKMTEDILVFFKKYENKQGHPLQQYFLDELESSGFDISFYVDALGTQNARKFFGRGQVYRLPTREQLEMMQTLTGCFMLDYETMREIDEDYRSNKYEEYPVVFNLRDGETFKTDVLEYEKDYPSLHPTQKPVALLKNLIETYTNPNALVCDLTMGSGSTGVACQQTGRRFIGIESDEAHYNVALDRLGQTNYI